VLNSLAGDFIPKSLSVLAPFGRFLEIGKIDVYRNTHIGLQRLKDNISYFVIDLAQHLQHKPAYAVSLLAEIAERFAAGEYRPLPHTVFPITKAAEAFRHMAQGKHVGKNVLAFDLPEIPIGPCTAEQLWFRGDASYLITGGAGGFCLEVAKWMARHGARHLVLMSRSGPRDESACQNIEQLRAAGVTVLDARGDVTQWPDVQRVVQQIALDLPPLRGVLHGAMVLDDEYLAELDEVRFNRVLEPKMAGAWNLHRATRDLPLEHFICFSSFSVMVGGPKQSNYTAGNHFLDALAHYRHGQGLPALTVDWGAILGAGFIERNRKTAAYLDKVGLKSFRLEEALRVLDRLLPLDPVQLTATHVDWRLLPQICPVVATSPTFAAMTRQSRAAEQVGSLTVRLQAVGAEARSGLIEDFLAGQVAGVFGIAEDKVDRDTPLTGLGLDSLMAIELKNRVEKELGLTIPMGHLLGGPSLKTLAQSLLRLLAPKLEGDAARESPAAHSGPPPAGLPTPAARQLEQALQEVDQLSDADVEAALSGLLKQ
jgi:NAD(P)-dependent dehydrogenase (short-subunit alcohol dehydrogenase family)/acyl carrier protein